MRQTHVQMRRVVAVFVACLVAGPAVAGDFGLLVHNGTEMKVESVVAVLSSDKPELAVTLLPHATTPEELEAVSAHPFRYPDTVTPTFCLAQHWGICSGSALAITERHSVYIKVKKKWFSSLRVGCQLVRRAAELRD